VNTSFGVLKAKKVLMFSTKWLFEKGIIVVVGALTFPPRKVLLFLPFAMRSMSMTYLNDEYLNPKSCFG
jgi:hypothetical protein